MGGCLLTKVFEFYHLLVCFVKCETRGRKTSRIKLCLALCSRRRFQALIIHYQDLAKYVIVGIKLT